MKSNRQKIFEKYGGHCAYCGEEITIKDMQVDHIIPKNEFWSHIKNDIHIPEFLRHLKLNDLNHIDNLNPACRVCNKWKSAFHLELFRFELSEQLKRLHKNIAPYRMAKKYGLIEEKSKPIVFYFETLQ